MTTTADTTQKAHQRRRPQRPRPRRPCRWLSGERGSAAAEAALVAPLLMLLALVAVGFGRIASTRMEVDSAARQAARAASLARDPDTAAAQARETATAALAENRITCDQMSIAVNTADYGPGGTVTVTVRCTTRLADVAMPGLPGRTTLHARFVSPVDAYRSDPGGGP